MLEDAVDHVRDGLETAVWMPRRALGLAGRVLHLAHLIEMDEWIQVLERDAGECPPNGEALPFHAVRGVRHAADRALTRDGEIRFKDAREDGQIFDDDCGHASWTPSVVPTRYPQVVALSTTGAMRPMLWRAGRPTPTLDPAPGG